MQYLAMLRLTNYAVWNEVLNDHFTKTAARVQLAINHYKNYARAAKIILKANEQLKWMVNFMETWWGLAEWLCGQLSAQGQFRSTMQTANIVT